MRIFTAVLWIIARTRVTYGSVLTASQTSSSVRANARMVYDVWHGSVFPVGFVALE